MTPDFRAFFEAASVLHVALRPRGLTIVAVSDAFLRATMMLKEELLGRGFFEVFPESPARISIERTLQTRAPDTMTAQRYAMGSRSATGTGGRSEAQARLWTAVSSPVSDGDGQIAFVIHTIEDVTEAVRSREASGADQLQAQLSAAIAARDEALRRSQLKTRFLGMVSHELRTPLTALCLQVERMQRNARDLESRHRESLERISFSAGRLREMIETLLEYARVDGGHVSVNTAWFDLGVSLQKMVENHREEAEHRGLELHCVSLATLAAVQSDRRLVELVISNLIDNAIKFTTAGRIDVTLGKSEDGAHRVAVSDSGPGIPEPQQKRIFEPFEQLGSPRQKPSGIGLGLALVRDIAGALGGRIELVSKLREGSTFTFVLPSGPDTPPLELPRETEQE